MRQGGQTILAGYLTRREGLRRRGEAWYQERFLPRIGPVALYGLQPASSKVLRDAGNPSLIGLGSPR